MIQLRAQGPRPALAAAGAMLLAVAVGGRAVTAPAQTPQAVAGPHPDSKAAGRPPEQNPQVAPDPMQAMAGHQDMMRSAPPELALNNWDARLKSRLHYGVIGGDAIIQGDIVIGTAVNVRQRTLYALAEQANRIGDLGDLGLTPDEKAVLDAISHLELPPPVAASVNERRTSQARSILADLLRSEATSANLVGYPAAQVATLKQNSSKTGGVSSIVQVGDRYRWPAGVIPYSIDSNVPNQSLIAAAIGKWHTQTDRIHLRPRTAADRDYVRFVAGAGCSSSIGRVGGEQLITLAPGCLGPQIIHEIGHAVGLWHEQCRNDRDEYIVIHDENISPLMIYNFDQAGAEGQDVGSFDFSSIMLYGCKAFSDNGRQTMVPRSPKVPQCEWGVESGYVNELSVGDLGGVNSIYRSPANPPNPRHPATAAADAPLTPPISPPSR